MVMYTLINVLVGCLFLVALGYLAFQLFAKWQGDEQIVLQVRHKKVSFKVEEISFNQVTLYADVPFQNVGRQNGTVMDVFPRVLLPQEQFDEVHVAAWTTNANKERHDGYWEAVIIPSKKGGIIRLRVILTAKHGNIRVDAKNFPDMPIDIVYQVVGRSDWYLTKGRVILTAQEVEKALLS